MPQMAPLLWLNLVIMFIGIYLVFIVMNYFTSTPTKLEEKNIRCVIENKIWKW